MSKSIPGILTMSLLSRLCLRWQHRPRHSSQSIYLLLLVLAISYHLRADSSVSYSSYFNHLDSHTMIHDIGLNRLDEICKNMANSLGLAEDKFNKDWSTLSGGERQRAIIGCALIAAMVSNGNEIIFLILSNINH